MTRQNAVIRDATESDLTAVLGMLGSCGLPTEDLTPEKLQGFIVVETKGAIAGVVGLEAAGAHALLRSLAVAHRHRGKGLARMLLQAIERIAAERGVQTLYLLTTTAETFFRARGYSSQNRQSVPSAIGATTEFASICPDSAVCLTREL